MARGFCGEAGYCLHLLAALIAVYFLPTSRLPQNPSLAGLFVALAFSVPVFFAGLLFTSELQKVLSPGFALGANVLGAVAGGLLENLSLLVGMRALLLITILLYCFAGVGSIVRSSGRSEVAA